MDEERNGDPMPDNPVAPGKGIVVDLNADGLYEVVLEKDRKTAVLIGLDPPFTEDRWSVMEARALAYGLTLVKREVAE